MFLVKWNTHNWQTFQLHSKIKVLSHVYECRGLVWIVTLYSFPQPSQPRWRLRDPPASSHSHRSCQSGLQMFAHSLRCSQLVQMRRENPMNLITTWLSQQMPSSSSSLYPKLSLSSHHRLHPNLSQCTAMRWGSPLYIFVFSNMTLLHNYLW